MFCFEYFDIEFNIENSSILRAQLIDIDNNKKRFESENSKEENLKFEKIIIDNSIYCKENIIE